MRNEFDMDNTLMSAQEAQKWLVMHKDEIQLEHEKKNGKMQKCRLVRCITIAVTQAKMHGN